MAIAVATGSFVVIDDVALTCCWVVIRVVVSECEGEKPTAYLPGVTMGEGVVVVVVEKSSDVL